MKRITMATGLTLFCASPLFSHAGMINYTITKNELEVRSFVQVDNAVSTNNISRNTEINDVSLSESKNLTTSDSAFGDEKQTDFVVGNDTSSTWFDFSENKLAEATATAASNMTRRDEGLSISMSGSTSAARRDDIITRTDVRTNDGQAVVTVTDYDYRTRAESFVRSTIRVDATTGDGIPATESTDFTFFSTFPGEAVIGDSLRNYAFTAVTGDIAFDGYRLIDGEKTELVSGRHNGNAFLDENGNIILDNEGAFLINGSFKKTITVDSSIRSALALQSEGGANTQYAAEQRFYTNLIIGEGTSQLNPVMPDISDDEMGLYQFHNGQSGAWFDPLPFSNYFFSMDSVDSFFTNILSFPLGFGRNFGIYAFDRSNNYYDLGMFDVMDGVDFSYQPLLEGIDVASFLVTGIDDRSDEHQFPIQLAFSTAEADFSMQGVQDAEAFLASFDTENEQSTSVPTPPTLLYFGIALLALLRKRQFQTI